MPSGATDARHTEQIEAHGLPAIVLRGGGCEARVFLQGAHVVSFRTPEHGELLWLSERASYAPGKAIRGGVPLCFPWFGAHRARPELPAHGFARTRAFRFAGSAPSGAGVVATFVLESDDETLALFPHSFVARLQVSVGVGGGRLSLAFEVENVGTAAFDYELALHTYLGVSDVRRVFVHGLEGSRYDDKVSGQTDLVEAAAKLGFEGETDRVYRSVSNVSVEDGARRILIEKRGSGTTVVWNPWREKAKRLVDVGDDQWPRLLCIEAGNTGAQRVKLGGGQRHVTETHVWAE